MPNDSDKQRSWAGHVVIATMCFLLLALIGRLAYLNGVQRPMLMEWSQPRQKSTVILPGCRGAILDRRFRVLAGSQNLPTVFADPRRIDVFEDAARQLSTLLDMSKEDILYRLENPTSPGFVALKRGVSQVIADEVQKLKIRGVGIQNDPVRTHPMGSVAAHVLGFVGKDGEGLEGIELAFEEYLKSRPGKRVVFRDERRRAMFQQPDSRVQPRDGVHVVLTLDVAIQKAVEKAVAEQVEHFEAEWGLGVAMEPSTGEVLAMANYPTFDLENPGEVPADSRRNRILTDPVEPGSIFKPFIMSVALAEGVTTADEKIFCEEGRYKTGKRVLNDHHPYGWLSTADILAHSSNIGMAKLGQRLGNQRMYEALVAMGYAGRTGIDLPGEDPGLLMPLKKWDTYTTTSVPMGHELAVTPIQVITAYSALVNGGRLVKPRVVRSIVDQEGRVLRDFSEVVDRGQAINPSTAMQMRQLLARVVNEGTGRKCNLDKWQVMGKTGTAQVPRMGSPGYEPNAYLASFIAAAPQADPAIAVLVMVRKPNRRIGYYGSQVALPAVRSILEQALPYLNATQDKIADQARLVHPPQHQYN